MTQCKDNCPCWQLANRLVQCYCQAYPSCPPPAADCTPACMRVCVFVCFCQTPEGGRAGTLQRSIDFYIRDITPNWVSGLPLPSTIVFLFPFSFPLHLRDTGMGPLGLWNICTITSAGSIQSFKLFSVPSLFCFARLLLPPTAHPPSLPPSLSPSLLSTTPQHDDTTNKLPPPLSLQQKYWREHQSSRMKDYLVALVNKSIHSKQF